MTTSLTHKTIVITRPKEQAAEMAAEIQRRGGRARVVPLIAIGPPDSWAECDKALEHIGSYGGLVFASANAVRGFLQRCKAKDIDLQELKNRAIMAVGKSTSNALTEYGFTVHVMPEQYTAAALVQTLAGERLQGMRLLVPRGNLGREALLAGLRELGAAVDAITVYSTSPQSGPDTGALVDDIDAGAIDAIVFASPSAVEQFARLVPESRRKEVASRICVAAIGPTTAGALKKRGWEANVVAEESTALSLVDALESYYAHIP